MFPFPVHSCYIYFHCSSLYNYYNYSQTMCIKCWSFSISHPDLIKFPYFADTTERGDRGRKQRRYGMEQRMTLPITLLSAEHCAKKSANIQRFDTHPILCCSHKKIDAHPRCYFVATKFNTHKMIRPYYLGPDLTIHCWIFN